jgi:Phosphoesterase family
MAGAGYLDNTVLVITFDEWGGFFEHVRPPQVTDTDPATVDHTGNSTTPTDGQLVPDYRQLGFRVPCIVVSNLARPRVAHDGPFEHTSTLKMIETTFGLQPLTARDAVQQPGVTCEAMENLLQGRFSRAATARVIERGLRRSDWMLSLFFTPGIAIVLPAVIAR